MYSIKAIFISIFKLKKFFMENNELFNKYCLGHERYI